MQQSQTPANTDTLCALAVARAEAEEQLELRIQLGHALLKSSGKQVELTALKSAFSEWTDYNVTLLGQIYTCDDYLNTYNAWYGRISRVRVWSESEEIEVTRQELEYKIEVLEDCLEELEHILGSDDITPQDIEDYDD
ncbi:hypothetical protein [Sulfurimonas sp. HSL3-7]|uniref:hypothetical protein n=1 Tax=Sulfonitrofixus jiaomeiensis TaxID=3131938 RepID=UPI0031F9EF2B